jgi:choline-glycine betaine transporter
MTVLGGIDFFYPLPRSPLMFGLVCALIVGSFLVSALTGLMKGISFLSSWNARIFVALSLFIFAFGPMGAILSSGTEAFGDYVTGFFSKSLFIGSSSGDPWPQSWSVFYWANWLAWAPVTAMFLGEIAYGYSVRAFIAMNWIIPSLFGIAWMSIFGGASLHLQITGQVDIAARMKVGGAESAIYALLEQYPFSSVVIAVFVFTTFLSFVTGADANTEAMGAISTRGVRADNPGASPWLKCAWGLAIGVVSWVMVSFAGLNGIKMLSNLGGFPALILVLAVSVGLSWIFVSGKYTELDRP